MPPRNQAALDFLKTRRSYPAKLMDGNHPSDAELKEILTVALRVPDHGKLEPWRIVVLRDAALSRVANEIEARGPEHGVLAEKLAQSAATYRRSGLAVLVVSAPVPSEKVPEIEQIQSAAALCLGLVNAASASGWGANWLTGWFAHDTRFRQDVFGLAENESVAGLIHIGSRDAHVPDRPRPDIDALTLWIDE